MNQLTLFDRGPRFKRFCQFHKQNPQVYKLFKHFASQARDRREHFGARMIGERLRWYTQIETTDADYKLNDHIWPYYARMLMLDEPERYADFFSTRDARFDATDEDLKDLMEGRI